MFLKKCKNLICGIKMDLQCNTKSLGNTTSNVTLNRILTTLAIDVCLQSTRLEFAPHSFYVKFLSRCFVKSVKILDYRD